MYSQSVRVNQSIYGYIVDQRSEDRLLDRVKSKTVKWKEKTTARHKKVISVPPRKHLFFCHQKLSLTHVTRPFVIVCISVVVVAVDLSLAVAHMASQLLRQDGYDNGINGIITIDHPTKATKTVKTGIISIGGSRIHGFEISIVHKGTDHQSHPIYLP